nr:MAG TPA: hypothetical protein [Caudoviricetes sp.]
MFLKIFNKKRPRCCEHRGREKSGLLTRKNPA